MSAERFDDSTGWGQTTSDDTSGWSQNPTHNNTSSILPTHQDERVNGYTSKESIQSQSTEYSGNAQQDWGKNSRNEWGQQQESRFDQAQQDSSQDWSRPKPRQQEQHSGASSRSTSFEPIPRAGHVPSPRERIRMAAAGVSPTAPSRQPYEDDKSRARPTSSGYTDRSAPKQTSRDGGQPSAAAPSRSKMSDSEFFAKYGFHFDDLPRATTNLSTSRRNSTQQPRELDSRQEQQRSSESVADQDVAPSWNLREDEPSWGQTETEKSGPGFSVIETRESPKNSSNDRLESNREQGAATTESSPHWSLDAPQAEPPKYQSVDAVTSDHKIEETRKTEPLVSNPSHGWSQAHQPETKQESSPSWSFDKTPSGHPVRCPQCQHEFTA